MYIPVVRTSLASSLLPECDLLKITTGGGNLLVHSRTADSEVGETEEFPWGSRGVVMQEFWSFGAGTNTWGALSDPMWGEKATLVDYSSRGA